MGRPPCCDKEGVKKGPWTPEEDLVLVSYIQQHGPGNWRYGFWRVFDALGLMRCSKSCRLRWTNYLRPGIKRGNFTDQEEKLIVHLQALLGNRWAAISSYLPERTDNDIKNYWNTHLKKKLKKMQNNPPHQDGSACSNSPSKGQWERRLQVDIHMAKKALTDAIDLQAKPKASLPAAAAAATTYASSTENISRLLQQGWMKKNHTHPSPKTTEAISKTDFSAMESCLFGLDSLSAGVSESASFSHDEFRAILPTSVFETWLFEEENNRSSPVVDAIIN
ncbi:hypothetical protein ZIOFF_049214 [Zingiber officinale]|uniref:Uncharacterized protein n=1 Tax=Zingiber officinale TaxID=94328 RepID=A0A8J5KUZ6_ZINOF|nr:hypothetical protein ZIOFF_049214 [Zingiber officinale]